MCRLFSFFLFCFVLLLLLLLLFCFVLFCFFSLKNVRVGCGKKMISIRLFIKWTVRVTVFLNIDFFQIILNQPISVNKKIHCTLYGTHSKHNTYLLYTWSKWSLQGTNVQNTAFCSRTYEKFALYQSCDKTMLGNIPLIYALLQLSIISFGIKNSRPGLFSLISSFLKVRQYLKKGGIAVLRCMFPAEYSSLLDISKLKSNFLMLYISQTHRVRKILP